MATLISPARLLHSSTRASFGRKTHDRGYVRKKHLRALVFEKRIKENWSHYLPLAQRIINYSVDGSIGTQPARVIFGLAKDLGRSKSDRLSGEAPRWSSKIDQGYARVFIKKSIPIDHRTS